MNTAVVPFALSKTQRDCWKSDFVATIYEYAISSGLLLNERGDCAASMDRQRRTATT